jgi:biopolymer transport protein ExbB
MSFVQYHDLTLDALYGCIAMLIFVIIERGLYLAYLSLRSARVGRRIDVAPAQGANPLVGLKGNDPISRAVTRYAALQLQPGVSRERLEDYSGALYIELDRKITARLWLLDTIITAAPLLGLLGTILGIMDTFTALAQGGVSDPGQVSRGIGLALVATAIGIATALLGLLGHNILQRCAHVLTEDFKSFVLRLAPGATAASPAAEIAAPASWAPQPARR